MQINSEFKQTVINSIKDFRNCLILSEADLVSSLYFHHRTQFPSQLIFRERKLIDGGTQPKRVDIAFISDINTLKIEKLIEIKCDRYHFEDINDLDNATVDVTEQKEPEEMVADIQKLIRYKENQTINRLHDDVTGAFVYFGQYDKFDNARIGTFIKSLREISNINLKIEIYIYTEVEESLKTFLLEQSGLTEFALIPIV